MRSSTARDGTGAPPEGDPTTLGRVNDPVDETSPDAPAEPAPAAPSAPSAPPAPGTPPRQGVGTGARLAVVGVALLGVLVLLATVTLLPRVADRLRPEPPNLDAVEVFEDLPTTHTEEAVDYPTEPPVSRLGPSTVSRMSVSAKIGQNDSGRTSDHSHNNVGYDHGRYVTDARV